MMIISSFVLLEGFVKVIVMGRSLPKRMSVKKKLTTVEFITVGNVIFKEK